MAKNPRLKDHTGQIFGDWTVLHQAGNAPGGGALWLCRCVCGTSRDVIGSDLRLGKSANCGCARLNRLGDLRRSHGDSRGRLYNIWKNMRARCDDLESANYGGRGISVCPSWQKYESFRDWATSNGYRDDLSIDRVDNNKGYYPQNCRWATRKTQSRNRRFVKLTSDGRPGPEVAEENGIPISTYNVRKNAGWSVDEAATAPYRKRRVPRKKDAAGRFC